MKLFRPGNCSKYILAKDARIDVRDIPGTPYDMSPEGVMITCQGRALGTLEFGNKLQKVPSISKIASEQSSEGGVFWYVG
jgi:hypothetical protein